MADVTVIFSLPDATFGALKDRADRDGTTPGSVLRAALRRELAAPENNLPERKPNALPGALRSLLSRYLDAAQNWRDLSAALHARGYGLRLIDGQLALFSTSDERITVDTTELGASYGALMRRFSAPFPVDRKTAKAQTSA